MPDMAVRKKDGALEEAIMDLTVWFPGAVDWHGIDVTIRFPGAARYTGASYRPGRAATKAEEEKVARYGRDVLPVAFETGGRLGARSTASLRRLAQLAAQTTGGLTTPQSLETRWRRALEAALLFAIADAHILALGGEQAAALAKSQPTVPHSAGTEAPQQLPGIPAPLTCEHTPHAETAPEMHVDLESSMAEILATEFEALFEQEEAVAAEWFGHSQPSQPTQSSQSRIAPACMPSPDHMPSGEGRATS